MAEGGSRAQWKRRLGRVPRAARWLAGIVVAIAVLGFLVLPPVVRHFGARAIGDALGRAVAIERVRINPFALSIRVNGLRIAEADGAGDAFSFDELYANLEAESLLRGGPVLRELRIENPHARLVRLDAGRSNWSDVRERLAARPASDDDSEPRFSVNNIQLVGGQVIVEDRPVELRHELTDIAIGLPLLSNLPSKVELFVQPVLSALVNGRPLQVVGRTRPFASERDTVLDVALDAFDFTPLIAYLPFERGFDVAEGRVSTRLEFSFSQPVDAAPRLVARGAIDLAALRVQGRDGAPMLDIPALTLTLADVEPLAGRWHFERLELTAPQFDVVRLADGTLNLDRLRPPSAPGKAEAPADDGSKRSAAVQFRLDHAKLSGGVVRFEDRAAAGPFRTELKDVTLEASALSTAADAVAEVALDFATDAGEQLRHRGKLRLDPLALDGRLDAENLKLARYAPYYAVSLPGGEIRDGRLDAGVGYKIEAGNGAPRVDVLADSIVLRDFVLAQQGQKEALATVPRLALSAVALSTAERRVRVGAVESKGGVFALTIARDGRLDALALLPPPAAPDGAAPAAGPPGAAKDAWAFAVDRFALADTALRFEDRRQPKPIVVKLDAITLAGDGFASAKGSTTKLRLDARVNKRGRATIDGTVALEPLKGELRLDLRNVDLLPLQPYVVEELNIAISRGALTTQGTLGFAAPAGGELALRFRGDLAVADFSSVDTNHSTDFLRWRGLRLAAIDVRTAPLAVAIGEIALDDFYTRLILDESGRLNLREIRQQPEAESGAGTPPAAGAAERTTRGRTTSVEVPPPAPAPPPISVGKIRFRGGNVQFSDRFIRPNYDANLTAMEGELTGLSSDPATLARLDLHGSIDNVAPVTVSGEFNPFREDRYLDIAASVKDFELPAVSAYSGKYVGYGIRKGKLSADLTYRIENRTLSATNRVFLDQLTFGDRVDSPDAPNLPVQLAVSLLQNRSGEIDLDLPIGGSLDDPQFSIGGLVVKAILNLIGKALTAPFALLGSVFGGGGEELSQLGFAPGSSALDAAAEEKIAALAKALAERPALRLDVAGHADPASDGVALKKVFLLRTMKGMKLVETVRRGEEAPPLDEVAIDDAEYAKWLERVYRDSSFERPRNFVGLLKDVPAADMEAALLAQIDVGDDAVRHLAEERGRAVRGRLLEGGNVPASRIFLLAPQVEAPQGGGDSARVVAFSLR